MPRKKKTEEVEKVDPKDAFIRVTIALPGQDPFDTNIKIINVKGEMLPSQMNKRYFTDLVKEVFRTRFGNKVQ